MCFSSNFGTKSQSLQVSSPRFGALSEEINVTQVRRLMRLTLLAPAVVEQLVGTSEAALEQLMRRPWPLTWGDQIRMLPAQT